MGVTPESVTEGDGVTPPGPLSVRAYARHRGTSAPAVLRAIKAGRLKGCLVYDEHGKAKIGDVALADAEWTANTDLSKAPGYVKARAAAPPEPDAPGRPLAAPATMPDATSTPSLADASAWEKYWKARTAELEFKMKAIELASAKEFEATLVDVFTRCKTKLLGVPSKLKLALPHLSHQDILVADRIIREQLEELARGEVEE